MLLQLCSLVGKVENAAIPGLECLTGVAYQGLPTSKSAKAGQTAARHRRITLFRPVVTVSAQGAPNFTCYRKAACQDLLRGTSHSSTKYGRVGIARASASSRKRTQSQSKAVPTSLTKDVPSLSILPPGFFELGLGCGQTQKKLAKRNVPLAASLLTPLQRFECRLLSRNDTRTATGANVATCTT